MNKRRFDIKSTLEYRFDVYSMSNQVCLLSVCVSYFMGDFKGYPLNLTQNILHIHWKMQFLYNVGATRALRFTSSYAFLKRRPDVAKGLHREWIMQFVLSLTKALPFNSPCCIHSCDILDSVTPIWTLAGNSVFVELCEYHGYWFASYLCHQNISSHDINYVDNLFFVSTKKNFNNLWFFNDHEWKLFPDRKHRCVLIQSMACMVWRSWYQLEDNSSWIIRRQTKLTLHWSKLQNNIQQILNFVS